MNQEMSCCGVFCSRCEYYRKECNGCDDIQGKPFRLEFTGEINCNIYHCCRREKNLMHCSKLPCAFYEGGDPTKSKEENEAGFRKQVDLLKHSGSLCIRPLKEEEFPLLEDMLYDAIYQPQREKKLSRDIIREPRLSVYIDGFGKEGDVCMAAELEGRIVGGAWARVVTGEVKGYGNLAPDTPELAISVKEEWRGKGIGARLLQALLEVMIQNGTERVSLSVNKENFAVALYKKMGFQIAEEQQTEYLMVKYL